MTEKPWLKYYGCNSVTLDKSRTVYQLLCDAAAVKGNDCVFAEQTTNKKMTYKELVAAADRLAAAMAARGIHSGNVVGLLTFYCFYEPVVIFAANKLGALLKFISPDFSMNELRESVSGVDMLFIDSFFTETEPAFNTKGITTVICEDEPTTHRDNCFMLAELSGCTDLPDITASVQTDKPSMIIYSSGTTGKAKPIVHSDFSILSAIEKMLGSDFPINDSNYILKVIPSYIGLGSITTMLTAIIGRTAFISIRPYDFSQPPINTLEIISNYRKVISDMQLDPDKGLLFFASPIFASVLMMNIDSINDLSFIKGVLLAGAKLDWDMIDSLNNAFVPKGLAVPLCNGYGQNEMAGAVALNTVHHFKNGSAGYPVYGTEIRIVDEKTHEDLPYNKVGLILENSKSLYLQYDKMPAETERSMITLPDGTTWFNSNDLGYMDEDGFIFITGRTTRVVMRTDHKISLEYLEEKIKRIEIIKDTAVIAMPDTSIIAYISLKDSETKNVEEIVRANGDFSFWENPEKIIITDNIPYMSNGKVDYIQLIRQAEEAS